ncbi:hypothetical protein [Shouchella lonarensis]|uniref:Transposase (putative) YhgA-like domain-containing protein n=1 Tax=Shouchella lonarensis TaxID=1464122 RepID=A0A1G6LF07_9BACI|nr:hypothetical protein [Shouchella lonarensis]SDC41176.1 conserved hypothetical protein (putative transposase or invertase) [Shouchella lonarensis]
MTSHHPPHDQLFRQLLDHFFSDFMYAFFPDIEADIDLDSSEPVSTDAWFSGEQKSPLRPDFVVKTRLKSVDVVILIHVEAQSSYDPHFHRRMSGYYARLVDRYQCPILPIAIFSYRTPEKEPATEVIHTINGRTYFYFAYENLFLKKLSWRAFMEMENPAAAALMSLMGYTEEEKVACKKAFLRLMLKMELKAQHRHFVMQFFDSYLILNDKEEMKLREEVKQLEPAESIAIKDFMTSYERRGWKKGKEEGRTAERTTTAKRMLAKGMDIAFIAEMTGMSEQKVRTLQSEQEEQAD